MDVTKIRLSPEEEALVTRADWILTKNSVLQKTMQLFAMLQTEQKTWMESNRNSWPDHIINTSPKISRGENYLGLPWLMLDYPRIFNKEEIFAARTFFWWGNFFSVTLQLSGKYQDEYSEGLINAYPELSKQGFFACIQEDQWHHHFGPDNYEPVSAMTAAKWNTLVRKKPFLKIANTVPLEDWNNAQEKLMKIFRQLMQKMTGQLPNL